MLIRRGKAFHARKTRETCTVIHNYSQRLLATCKTTLFDTDTDFWEYNHAAKIHISCRLLSSACFIFKAHPCKRPKWIFGQGRRLAGGNQQQQREKIRAGQRKVSQLTTSSGQKTERQLTAGSGQRTDWQLGAGCSQDWFWRHQWPAFIWGARLQFWGSESKEVTEEDKKEKKIKGGKCS